jgi:hypothetical protein
MRDDDSPRSVRQLASDAADGLAPVPYLYGYRRGAVVGATQLLGVAELRSPMLGDHREPNQRMR